MNPPGGFGTIVSPGLVAAPMVVGLLAEIAGWGLIALRAPLGAGWYGAPSLLVGVHLVVIGGLLLPILGAGWQLVPVVSARPLATPRLAAGLNAAALIGALLLWIGLSGAGALGAIGALLLIGATLGRSVVLIGTVALAPGRGGIRGWMLAAEGCLWAGLAFAAALYLGRMGLIGIDPFAGIGRHVSLLAAGWVGGMELGLGMLLLPMFGLGKEPQPGLALLVGIGWFASIALGLPGVWAIAALAAAAMSFRSIGALRGPGLVQAALALVGLAFTALIVLLGAPAHVIVASLLALWLLPFQHGVATRIAPFLVWAHALAGRTGASPAALVDLRVAWLQVAATAVGGGLFVAGLQWHEGLARGGAAALFAGSALHFAGLVGVGARGFIAWRAAAALPGTRRSA